MKVTEEQLETAALEILEDTGYKCRFGPDISPSGNARERDTYKDVILQQRLRTSLRKLNPKKPKRILDEVLRELIKSDSPSLLQNNQVFHRKLVEGITVEYYDKDRVRSEIVKIIDFEDPEMNEFLAVNQYTVIEGEGPDSTNRRPDIVLFINGLPLVVIELKNPADETTTAKQAYNQLQVYKKEIPSLFVTNELLVISDGYEAKAGSLSASWERFTPWRTVEGETEVDQSRLQLEVLIRGILDPTRLLDYIRYFITFQDNELGDIIKIVAAYHQFHAVNQAVIESLRATGISGDQKIGVVWHTQGSGKSLTMLFYTAKLIQLLDNPTIVVITDRNDLDGQLFSTFSSSRDLLRQTPVQAGRRRRNKDDPYDTTRNLEDLLQTSGGGIIFTTIQKFFPEMNEEYPTLSERRNIVVIADEAHRSQYSFNKRMSERGQLRAGFAAHIRKALPNASFIGFTGTPIELVDRNTVHVFGNYISIYDISQAINDNTTVPIYYEARFAKIRLNESLEGLIDEEFDDITESEEEYVREKLKTKWSRVVELISDPDRLRKIAEDLVYHFEQRLSSIEGKGLIVCMTRRLCVQLYDEIIKQRPEWHSDDDSKGKIKVIISGSIGEEQPLARHIRSKSKRKLIEKRIKDSGDELQLVIVCSMWLTGFDVPHLHTMYVDKPLQGHNLMQAIARVNRVYKDKPGGLIVDYIGIGYSLKQALSSYSNQESRDQTGISQDKAVQLMLTYHEITTDMFFGFDFSVFSRGDALQRLRLLPDAMEHILNLEGETPETAKRRFLDNLTTLDKAFSLAIPHDEALSIRDDIAFFQAVRAGLVKSTTPIKERREKIEHAIKQLISDAVLSEDVIDVFSAVGLEKPELSILSEEFLEEIKGLKQKSLAVELLNKLLQDQIRSRVKRNLMQSRSFEELLKKSITRYINRTIESAAILEELIDLAKKMQAALDRGQNMGLSEDEIAFYDALASNESALREMTDETLKQVAKELVAAVRRSATIDFTVRKSVQAKMRIETRKLLKRYKYPADQTPQAIHLIMEQAMYFGEEWVSA